EPDTAVAHDDGRHAVPARRRQLRIPAHLAVVVGVDVDPTGRENEPAGVDLTPPALVDGADGTDPRAVDGDVAAERWSAGAVRDRRPADHDVVHGVPLGVGLLAGQVCRAPGPPAQA